jgi:hypothetical protein
MCYRDGVNHPPSIDPTFPYLTVAPAKMKLKTRVVLKILTKTQEGKRTWPANPPRPNPRPRRRWQTAPPGQPPAASDEPSRT